MTWHHEYGTNLNRYHISPFSTRRPLPQCLFLLLLWCIYISIFKPDAIRIVGIGLSATSGVEVDHTSLSRPIDLTFKKAWMTLNNRLAAEIHHYQVTEAGSILQQKTCRLSESFVVDGVASTVLVEQIASIPTKVFRFTRNHFNPPLTFSSTVPPCQKASTHSELKIIWDHWDLRCPARQFHASRNFWTIKTANTHSKNIK